MPATLAFVSGFVKYNIAITSIVKYHRQAEQRRSGKNHHDANEDALVRYTRGLNRATWIIGVAAFLTVGVGVLQYAILKQTDATQRATQRAVVVSYEMDIHPGLVDNRLSFWTVTPILENAGGTPSVGLRSRLMEVFFSRVFGMRNLKFAPSADDPDGHELEFSGLPAATTPLGPKAKLPMPTTVVSVEHAAMLRMKTLSLFLFGEAEYEDIFGGPHKTKFCYVLYGSEGNTGNIGRAGTVEVVPLVINELTYRLCLKNNCTDRDCGPNVSRLPIDESPSLRTVAQ